MRMRHIVNCGLPPLHYISIVSHKRHDFQGGEKTLLQQNVCFDFLQILSETDFILRIIREINDQKCILVFM